MKRFCKKCERRAEFYVSHPAWCKECHKRIHRTYYWRNRNRELARQRRRYSDPVKRAHDVNRAKRWYRKNKERVRIRAWARQYGLTETQFQNLWKQQKGRCAVCKKPVSFQTRNSAHVDHCHATQKIRGVLCGKCNRGLGHFDDQPTRLRDAALYIEKHR